MNPSTAELIALVQVIANERFSRSVVLYRETPTGLQLHFKSDPGRQSAHQALWGILGPRGLISFDDYKRRVTFSEPKQVNHNWEVIVTVDALESAGDDSEAE